VGKISDFFRSTFSFLGTKSQKEEALAAYVIREHDRGRPLAEIMDDPYVRNRATEQERARILDRPEVIHALGQDAVDSARNDLAQS
jgi:hypothetical protein